MKTLWQNSTGNLEPQSAQDAQPGDLRVLVEATTGKYIGRCRVLTSGKWRAKCPDGFITGIYSSIHAARVSLIKAEQGSHLCLS